MKKIGIIGAGLTGLTAAYRLSRKGYKVTVFEAGNKAGGLARTIKIDGSFVEQSYHHIFKNDKVFIGLLTELGLVDQILWRDVQSSLFYDNTFHQFSSPFDIFKLSNISLREKIDLSINLYKLTNLTNYTNLYSVTAYEWIKENLGKNILNTIFIPLLKSKFDDEYKDISMAWLCTRLKSRSSSRKRLFSSETLGYIKNSFKLVVDKLVDEIRNNSGEVFLDSEVIRISKEEKGASLFTKNKKYYLDFIISTVPNNVFANLIKSNDNVSKFYTTKLKSIEYIGYIGIIFSSSQSLTDYYWSSINDNSVPFIVFINHTKLADKDNFYGNNIYYLGAYFKHDHKYFRISDRLIKDEWFRKLRRIFPKFKQNKITSSYVIRKKYAQHIPEINYQDKIINNVLPLKGVYDVNFSQIFPEDRSMNLAVKLGNDVADRIITDIGI